MSFGVYLVILLSLLFIGWFGIGYWLNLKKKSKILKQTLNVLSGELKDNTKYTSLASTGFMLWTSTGNLKLHLRLFLGKREFPIMWVMDYLRGRIDRLEVYLELQSINSCSRASYYNVKSYWGKLYSKRVKGRFRSEGGWVVKGENRLFEELKEYSYVLLARREGGKCYFTIVCKPETVGRVLNTLLSLKLTPDSS